MTASFNAADQTTAMTAERSGGTVGSSRTAYRYDENGNRVTQTAESGDLRVVTGHHSTPLHSTAASSLRRAPVAIATRSRAANSGLAAAITAATDAGAGTTGSCRIVFGWSTRSIGLTVIGPQRPRRIALPKAADNARYSDRAELAPGALWTSAIMSSTVRCVIRSVPRCARSRTAGKPHTQRYPYRVLGGTVMLPIQSASMSPKVTEGHRRGYGSLIAVVFFQHLTARSLGIRPRRCSPAAASDANLTPPAGNLSD